MGWQNQPVKSHHRRRQNKEKPDQARRYRHVKSRGRKAGNRRQRDDDNHGRGDDAGLHGGLAEDFEGLPAPMVPDSCRMVIDRRYLIEEDPKEVKAEVVAILEALEVDVVFGLCGDTSLPFYDALAKSEGIRHVLTRDERCASFMADAYARLSGRVGVCEGPSGGGATYILPGVAEANDSSVPLVCLTSDIGVEDRGKGTLTELDQAGLFRPVTKRVFSPTAGAHLPDMLRDAFREATTGSLGACHVSLPLDLKII